MATRIRPGDSCELLPLLRGVVAWENFNSCYPEWAFLTLDPHHVHGNRWFDEPWNVVTACRVAHEFCHDCWQKAGVLIGMTALQRAGRLDLPRTIAALRYDPLARLAAWIGDGIFAGEPLLRRYADELLAAYGRSER